MKLQAPHYYGAPKGVLADFLRAQETAPRGTVGASQGAFGTSATYTDFAKANQTYAPAVEEEMSAWPWVVGIGGALALIGGAIWFARKR